MSNEFFPKEILALPEADVTFPGVRGRLFQGPDQQLVFFEIDTVGEVEPHAHGAQWGVVLDGAMDMTIGGETRLYKPGATYFIPSGVVHSAKARAGAKIMDFFEEPDRYRLR